MHSKRTNPRSVRSVSEYVIGEFVEACSKLAVKISSPSIARGMVRTKNDPQIRSDADRLRLHTIVSYSHVAQVG
jgi:hypothetical protein